MREASRLRRIVVAAVALLFLSGCSHGNDAGRWSVASVSADGRVVHIGVDVSCSAKVTGSHVHEHEDRVAIDVDTRGPAGTCQSSLVVRDVQVRLRTPLGARWLDGACVNGCPNEPTRAPLHCAFERPFAFGFLPSGWETVKNAPTGVVAAYQSADGTQTMELAHSASAGGNRVRTGGAVYALGTAVPLDTVPGGYAFTVHLRGRGPGCGDWTVVAHGPDNTTLTMIAQQIFPL